MTQGGRKRRSEENPDSKFGITLKGHLRRIPGFTQVELAGESLVAPETISRMVKGQREPTRDNVRAIIKALHKNKALLTLTEANALILSIPTNGALDERDDADRQIIALFDPPETEIEQAVSLSHVDDVALNEQDMQIFSENLDEDEGVVSDITLNEDEEGVTAPGITVSEDDVTAPDIVPEPPVTSPVTPVSVPPPPEPLARGTRKYLWWYISSGLALLVIVGLILVMTYQDQGLSHQSSTKQLPGCSSPTNGVTLYTDINYQGQCHTFGLGSSELALSGLEQNVSSIKDPNDAYHIRLFDKDKNFYNVDTDTPVLPAEWDNRADTIFVEKHRPTSCAPGTNGIIAFINPDYSGGCLFITESIPDLTPLNFDGTIVSIQFVGSFQNTRQLVLYLQPGYKEKCGTYWQDQSDLWQCARKALSVQVLPFVPPTPIPAVPGTHDSGNVVPQATLLPASASAAADGNLRTEWVGGHMVELDLTWAFPVTIHRVVVWDRKQSATDNNQINKLKLFFSDGTATGSLDMISSGPRCVDVTFPEKTVTWLHILPVDASGNNGYREVEVWATTGPQYSNNTCVHKVTVAQTIP